MNGPKTTGEKTSRRLVAVTIDEASIGRASADIEHERAVAIYDLLEDNSFCPTGIEDGPFALNISLAEGKLAPAQIAELAVGRLRQKLEELTLALEGSLEAHHRFRIRQERELRLLLAAGRLPDGARRGVPARKIVGQRARQRGLRRALEQLEIVPRHELERQLPLGTALLEPGARRLHVADQHVVLRIRLRRRHEVSLHGGEVAPLEGGAGEAAC